MRSTWFSSIWIGPGGLRSGWGLLLYALILVISIRAVDWLATVYGNFNPAYSTAMRQAEVAMRSLEGPGPSSAFLVLWQPLVVVLFVPWVMSLIERRDTGVYGLGGRQCIRDFSKGLLSGFAVISALVGILWLARLLVFDGPGDAGNRVLFYGLKWLLVFGVAALVEGYLFLGYLQYTLTRTLAGLIPKSNPLRYSLGFWLAAFLLSAGFALGHSSHATESPVGLFSAFCFNLVCAYSLFRSGSLWWALGLHGAADWAQSFFYGVSDSGLNCHGRLLTASAVGNPLFSGGLTGPEGSLWMIGVLCVAALLVRCTLPNRPYLDRLPGVTQSTGGEVASVG